MPSPANIPLLEAFASELKARRGKLEISQEELAHRADISRTFLAKIETAVNQPTLTAIFKIAQGLDADPEELIKSVTRRYRRSRQI